MLCHVFEWGKYSRLLYFAAFVLSPSGRMENEGASSHTNIPTVCSVAAIVLDSFHLLKSSPETESTENAITEHFVLA